MALRVEVQVVSMRSHDEQVEALRAAIRATSLRVLVRSREGGRLLAEGDYTGDALVVEPAVRSIIGVVYGPDQTSYRLHEVNTRAGIVYEIWLNDVLLPGAVRHEEPRFGFGYGRWLEPQDWNTGWGERCAEPEVAVRRGIARAPALVNRKVAVDA